MLYVNETGFASTLFKNTNLHVEKQLSPGQQKALELTGATGADTDTTLKEIESKLQNGMELSPSELEYLRKNSPDLYREAIKLIELRKKIEQRLSQCKSKEQVAKAQSEISSQIAMECDVSPSKKCSLQQAKMYERRINLAKNTFVKFAKTDDFRNFPDTDAEYVKLKAEKIKEAFGDKLEISDEGRNSAKIGKEDTQLIETDKADGENIVTDVENEKKLEAAENKKPKRNSTESNTLYTSDYRQQSLYSPQALGFNVKA